MLPAPDPPPSTLTRALSLKAEAADLQTSGNLAQATQICREAVTLLNGDPPPTSPRLAFLWFALGNIFEPAGAFAEALTCAEASLTAIESLLPGNGGKSGEQLRLRALGLLVTALRQLGEYAKAETHAVRQIELATALPDGSPAKPAECSIAWNNLGMLCKYAGWFERGAAAYEKALAFAEGQSEGASRQSMLAAVLHNIGGLRHARGLFREAEEPARRAWEIRRDLLGEDHLATLADATAYAAVLDGLKRYMESRPIYEHALEVFEKTLGPEHYEVAATLHNLALVENAQGNRAQAIVLARRSLALKTSLLGTNHPDTALSAMNLASLLPVESSVEARGILAASLIVFERTLHPDHPNLERCHQLLERRSVA